MPGEQRLPLDGVQPKERQPDQDPIEAAKLTEASAAQTSFTQGLNRGDDDGELDYAERRLQQDFRWQSPCWVI